MKGIAMTETQFKASQAGLVVTIETLPQLPLAMGNYSIAVNVREARHAPTAPCQPLDMATYPPLNAREIHDLTCMHAGAPWPDEMLPELGAVLAIYDQLRASGARPVDPADVKGGA
jgi:hypothetical protein